MTGAEGFRLPRRPRRAQGSVVPMINIVFLLLVFFMLTATIAPPEPFEIAPPVARGTPAEAGGDAVLHVAADGALAFGAARGAAALEAVAGLPEGAAVTVQADGALDGAAFAGLLAQLAAAGVAAVSVVVRAP